MVWMYIRLFWLTIGFFWTYTGLFWIHTGHFWICIELFFMLFWMYVGLFSIYTGLVWIYRALLNEHWALLNVYRALFNRYRADLTERRAALIPTVSHHRSLLAPITKNRRPEPTAHSSTRPQYPPTKIPIHIPVLLHLFFLGGNLIRFFIDFHHSWISSSAVNVYHDYRMAKTHIVP